MTAHTFSSCPCACGRRESCRSHHPLGRADAGARHRCFGQSGWMSVTLFLALPPLLAPRPGVPPCSIFSVDTVRRGISRSPKPPLDRTTRVPWPPAWACRPGHTAIIAMHSASRASWLSMGSTCRAETCFGSNGTLCPSRCPGPRLSQRAVARARARPTGQRIGPGPGGHPPDGTRFGSCANVQDGACRPARPPRPAFAMASGRSSPKCAFFPQSKNLTRRRGQPNILR